MTAKIELSSSQNKQGNSIGPGVSSRTPRPIIPFLFLFTSLLALSIGGILTFYFALPITQDPTSDKVVATAHLYLLGFMTLAILGALHQFIPVITLKRLFSVRLAYFTYGSFLIGIVLLLAGLILKSEEFMAVGGLSLAVSILSILLNLYNPLLKGNKSVSRNGLRISILYLVVTAGFGVTFASTHNSYSPPTHLVLAHASLGLIGWAAISYISVAEKLWPMFLLSHGNQSKYGLRAIYLVAIGELGLAIGFIFANKFIGAVCAVIIILGILSHLRSLLNYIKHRNRKLELLHGYILTSVLFLIAFMVVGILAFVLKIDWAAKEKLSVLAVVLVVGWLASAIIGHLHKIVPFIAWGILRRAGLTRSRNNKPLMFANLYVANLAKLSLILIASGFICFGLGVLTGFVDVIKVAGILISITSLAVFLNLSITPLSLYLRFKSAGSRYDLNMATNH
jgi:hypothetical protein